MKKYLLAELGPTIQIYQSIPTGMPLLAVKKCVCFCCLTNLYNASLCGLYWFSIFYLHFLDHFSLNFNQIQSSEFKYKGYSKIIIIKIIIINNDLKMCFLNSVFVLLSLIFTVFFLSVPSYHCLNVMSRDSL